MLFQKQTVLPLQLCSTCGGRVKDGLFSCSDCGGSFVLLADGDCAELWKVPLTSYAILLRRMRRYVRVAQMLFALVGALGAFALFLLPVFKDGSPYNPFSDVFWSDPSYAAERLFLWVAAIFLCFLFYRVRSSRQSAETIKLSRDNEPVSMDRDPGVPEGQRLKNVIHRYPRKKCITISSFFAKGAIEVLESSVRIAKVHASPTVQPVHMVFALLQNQHIKGMFVRLGVSAQSLQARLTALFEQTEKKQDPIFSQEAWSVVFSAYHAAKEGRQSNVRETELLLAAVQQSEPLQELFYDVGIDQQKLLHVIEWIRIREELRRQYHKFRRAAAHRNKYGLDRAMTAVATPYLNSFSQDLTMAGQFGHLAPCVARDREIDEIFRVIEGGGQSVLLVGEPGVGKMSIIEGIVQRMIEDATPEVLRDKRLVQVSTSALLAGTTMSGAQERLMKMMQEVAKARNIILFINNIHDLVSPGGKEGGSGLDVSETLSEYLGPGKFLTFATTNAEGYNRHILNSEISSVFTRVEIQEMTEDQAIQVLESKVGSVEYKHQVFFSYDALAQIVRLSKRFLQEQRLPESAMSILFEVASHVRHTKGKDQLVLAEDVAQIVSEKTGIPTTSISEDETSKLLRLEEQMHECVVGQDEAVSLVANALRRARAEIRSQKRPISNFLFLGPTGVGKTELAKTIANVYFGGEDRMIRIDMSEYQDKTGIARLIGQPGVQGSGLLTEAVRQRPFSLVLLDEMEKADPDILNLFLQVFDDGRLTDSVGRVIDFTNTIIIATSNAGTPFVQEQVAAGIASEDIRQQLIKGELKKYYRPEFLNRFDAIVLFTPLTREEIKKIAGLMLKRVGRDLEGRGVFLRVEPAALESLAEVGFDPEFGARPMRRAIQDTIENRLAELVLAGSLHRRDTITIGQGLTIEVSSGTQHQTA